MVRARRGLHRPARRPRGRTDRTDVPPARPANPALLTEWIENYERYENTIVYPSSLWVLGAGVAVGLAYFLSVLLHEVGHLLAAHALGLEVTALQLSFTGGFVEFADDERLTAGRLALIAVAGPLVTACLALASGLALIVVGWPLSDSIERQTSADVVAERTLASLVIINGLALVINLLPFRSFDGGQLVNAILLSFARGR